MSLPAHGTIRYIGEILADPETFPSVRTFGTLTTTDFAKDRIGIEHEGNSLQIDTDLLSSDVGFKRGSLYMFIGEIVVQQGCVLLRARIAENVDGMDLDLFATALKLRRKFEDRLAKQVHEDVVMVD